MSWLEGHAHLLHQRGVAERHVPAGQRASDAYARARFEFLRLVELETALVGRADDRLRQRVLAALVEARGKTKHFVFGVAGRRHDPVERRLAFGQRAGLVDDQRVDLAEVLDRGRVAEEDALRRALPVATMIDIGVARPRAHGQAMMSTATALIKP